MGDFFDWIRRLIQAVIDWLRRIFGKGNDKPHDPLDEDEIPGNEVNLEEDRSFISPPVLDEPLYQCSSVVVVISFVPHATIDIEIDGNIDTSVTVGFPDPSGEAITVSAPLVAGQVIRAQQRTPTAQSDWSDPVTVGDHTADFPAGLPRPEISPAPVHECGARTGVRNLLIGSNVWITADGSEVGRVNGSKEHQGVNVNPDYSIGQAVRALAELCSDPSSPSAKETTVPPPAPLPTPVPDPLYEGGEQARITGLANGARFTVFRDGIDQGTYRTWGQVHLVGLNPVFSAGETISATQRMCPGSPESSEGSTVVQPCSSLPAPKIAPVQGGDTVVHVTESVAGAQIKVFVNGVKRGDSGGSLIPLSQPVQSGDTLHVQQIVGTCVGSTLRVVTVRCVAPHVGGDPSALNLFPVGVANYAGNDVNIDGRDFSIKGSVYYPAQDDGQGQPFHTRLAELGPVPIVFIAHGNHGISRDPDNPIVGGVEQQDCDMVPGWDEIQNHEGYDYFQRRLARMGIIAVSIFGNETNCWGWTDNIMARAGLINATIAYFQSLDSGGDPIFGGRIDFNRVGLLGHSRGGDAVVTVPEITTLAISIRAVIALAPTDAGANSGVPDGYGFMTILPAGDGDVRANNGAKYYDQARPSPLKCQLYVHHTNHNFFNRQWLQDDGKGPAVMSRYHHERVLTTYGCAFYRALLLGHSTTDYLVGRLLPPATRTDDVQISAELSGELTVDHHEDGNGIDLNSLGQPTSRTGGMVADEHGFSQSAASAFNSTFYGDTTGMVMECEKRLGTFRSQLAGSTDVRGREIWIRMAEVFDGNSVPPNAAGFELGLEDENGTRGWVDSDGVGGIPRPYDRTADDGYTKTMPKTLRFPTRCFSRETKLDLQNIVAILIRCNRDLNQPLAADVLQIVSN
jgi:hypothetical protein